MHPFTTSVQLKISSFSAQSIIKITISLKIKIRCKKNVINSKIPESPNNKKLDQLEQGKGYLSRRCSGVMPSSFCFPWAFRACALCLSTSLWFPRELELRETSSHPCIIKRRKLGFHRISHLQRNQRQVIRSNHRQERLTRPTRIGNRRSRSLIKRSGKDDKNEIQVRNRNISSNKDMSHPLRFCAGRTTRREGTKNPYHTTERKGVRWRQEREYIEEGESERCSGIVHLFLPVQCSHLSPILVGPP